MYMCVYICINIYTYLYVSTRTYIYIYIYVYIYIYAVSSHRPHALCIYMYIYIQILLIVLMLAGAIVFANLMTTVQNIQSNIGRVSNIEEKISSQAQVYLRKQGIPPRLERRVLAWLDFDTVLRDQDSETSKFPNRLPAVLLEEVMAIANSNGQNGCTEQLPLFKHLDSSLCCSKL